MLMGGGGMKQLRRLVVTALLALGALGLGGCGRYHEPSNVGTTGRGHGELGVWIPGNLYRPGGILSVEDGTPSEQPTYVTNVIYVNGSGASEEGPQARHRAEREAPVELASFDPHAARRALDAIDVSPCKAAGARSGFGHAKVTMNPDGTASKVVVDEPTGMTPEAAKCVGDRLGTATVGPFRGSMVTVGTSFLVK